MHRYFTASDWGLNWPGGMAVVNASIAPPPPPPLDHGWEVAMGPWFVLGGFVLGITLNTNRMIGDVACAWRLSYSPKGPAFGIWGVIYLWTLTSIILQLAHGYSAPTYIGEPQSNYLMAFTWLLVGIWGVTFGRGAEDDVPGFIGLSAFVLVAAAMLSLGAVGIEQSWRSRNPWKMAGVGAPYALLAGWLCVAAAANVGIAIKAATTPPDPRCTRGRYRRAWEEDPVDTSSGSAWVPLVLASTVSVGAFLIPDPVLTLPIAWAVWNMKRHLKNWVALEVLAVTFVATTVQVATERWVVKDVK